MNGAQLRSFRDAEARRRAMAAFGHPLSTTIPGPCRLAASTLKGDPVLNYQGEELGTIQEIMLDVESGQIAYAVLAFGGVLGLRRKLMAVPWDALALDPDRKCFILDADKQALEQAPGFDKDHWPATADAGWAMQAYSSRKAPPYQ